MISNLYISGAELYREIPKENYLYSLPVVRYLKKNRLVFEKPVTMFVGENGSGKSTLIEAIAVLWGFNAEGGTKNFMFKTEDSHSDLNEYMRISRGGKRAKDGFFFRAESFYNAATYLNYLERELPGILNYYGGISLHNQSHGESFLACMENRFSGNGIYILDEPEAALSPSKVMRLMCLINELVKKDSQFIISTHSPILMTYPGADIRQITENGISKVNYTETDHYIVTKSFFENPERMLSYLLE